MRVYDGKKIVALREAKGWKQSELARRTSLSQPTIWALEHERTVEVKHATLEKVASALGVPVKALLREKATTKDGAALQEDLMAKWDTLTDANKFSLLVAAQALLDSQKRK